MKFAIWGWIWPRSKCHVLNILYSSHNRWSHCDCAINTLYPYLAFNCASFDNGHGLFGLSTYRVHRMVTEKCFLVEPSSKVRGIFCHFSPVFSSFLRPQLSDLAEILVEFWGVVWQCVIQFLLEFDALWLGNGSKTGWDTGRKLRKTRQKLAIASWFSPVLVSLLASLGGNWITNRKSRRKSSGTHF